MQTLRTLVLTGLLLCYTSLASADWLNGSRGGLPSSVAAITGRLTIFEVPPPSCNCLSAAELRLIAGNGYEFVVQVGRFPGDTAATPRVRAQWRYQIADAQGILRWRTSTTNIGPQLENYYMSATVQRSPVSAVIKWRKPTDNFWSTTTITPTLPDGTPLPWTGAIRGQLQTRNTAPLPMAATLSFTPFISGWALWASPLNPFDIISGTNPQAFTVDVVPVAP